MKRVVAVAALTCACGAPRVDPARNHVDRTVVSSPAPDAGGPRDAVELAAPDGARAGADAAPAQITFVHGAGGARDRAKIDAALRRCDASDYIGCHALGLALMTPGEPDSPNNQRAFAAFDKGCSGGYAPSCNGLGVMYATGLGVARDEAKAVAIQIKACEDGSETGCVHVAIAYETGRGVAKSAAKALEYYERACKLGSTPYCRGASGSDKR